MVRVENLSKKYGPIIACEGVSFNIEPGKVTALAGPNGAGKSTVLKIIAGVLSPDSGKVTVGTYDVTENPVEARSITGILFENAPLYSDMTVREHLMFAARLFGATSRQAAANAARLMERCKLEAVADRLAAGLSRGYRQRTGLALALVHDPEILVLDEPTSGLDPVQLAEFRSIIHSISGTTTVLLSTHVMQEVESLCSGIVIMNKGHCVAKGSIADICAAAGADSIENAFLSIVGTK
jgi:ABC-2 type transport system ATP-binding protein